MPVIHNPPESADEHPLFSETPLAADEVPAATDGVAVLERLLECPKTMTNGPCGGVGLDGSCEVARDKLCCWYEAVEQGVDFRQRATAVDWSGGEEAWRVAFEAPPAPAATPATLVARSTPSGDGTPQLSGSRLERLLRRGEFVVTCELNPHDSASGEAIQAYARTLAPFIDAAHISDNSLASPHMCGLAVAALVQQVGIEPILHMTCRDRNRLMLQSDLLGAHALGVRNVLCLTGDHPRLGDHPSAKPVFDLDSLTFLDAARRLRDEGRFLDGERTLDVRPKLFLGGAVGLTSPPLDFRPQRMAKKIEAGASFVVTQLVFDMQRLARFVNQIRDMGLLEHTHFLVGIGALSGVKMARAINEYTPGVYVPDAIVKRLEGAPPKQRRAEGLKICVEQLQQLSEMEGVSGVDVMDLDPRRWFPTGEIVKSAGLLPRPSL